MKSATIEDIYNAYLTCSDACTDTRSINNNSIFFALKGPNFNANKFADQAIEKGASFVVIDDENVKKDERYLLVKDVLTALQEVARYHRRQLTIPIIGITGSNGKTTTKELLHAVLNEEYNVLSTIGNYNNHIGVPLTLLRIKSSHEIAIIEMGANHQKEIGFLCAISQPDFGIITNIGKAHLEGFGGVEGVIKGKRELYDYIEETEGVLFVNKDDELLSELSFHLERVTYGTTDNVDFIGELVESEPFLSLECGPNTFNNSTARALVKTNLVGDYNFYNAMVAACVGNHFKVSALQIKHGLERYIPSNNRSQILKKGTNEIVLDAYNANPSSMAVAIKNIDGLNASNKLLILGDMLELGEDTDTEHVAILEQLKECRLSNVLFVGPHFNKAINTIGVGIGFENATALSEYLSNNPVTNTTILIKGSRGIKLETIVDAL